MAFIIALMMIVDVKAEEKIVGHGEDGYGEYDIIEAEYLGIEDDAEPLYSSFEFEDESLNTRDSNYRQSLIHNVKYTYSDTSLNPKVWYNTFILEYENSDLLQLNGTGTIVADQIASGTKRVSFKTSAIQLNNNRDIVFDDLYVVTSSFIPFNWSLKYRKYHNSNISVSFNYKNLQSYFHIILDGKDYVLADTDYQSLNIHNYVFTRNIRIYYEFVFDIDYVLMANSTASPSFIPTAGFADFQISTRQKELYIDAYSIYSSATQLLNNSLINIYNQQIAMYQLYNTLTTQFINKVSSGFNVNHTDLVNVKNAITSFASQNHLDVTEVDKDLVLFKNNTWTQLNEANKWLNDIHHALTNADGNNNPLDNANNDFKNEMDGYHNVTDTTQQFDLIDDSLLTFDGSVFSSLTDTTAFFATCVTNLWTAMGDFSVPLTMFLVMTLVGLVTGVAVHKIDHSD